MPTVEIYRFFPDSSSAENACARIEAEIATLEAPKNRGAQVYQYVLRSAITGYIQEARAASSEAKKWRSIAEAMFWWSAAHSITSSSPYCQPKGAAANRMAALRRAIEAQRIRQAGHPNTGTPWKNQEECVQYLQGAGLGTGGGDKDKKVRSRTAILKALKMKIPGLTSTEVGLP